jgi:hypothetical protein
MLKKIGIFGLFAVLIGSFGLSQSAFAETIFSENFDGTLGGWTLDSCTVLDSSQSCSIIQSQFAQPPTSFNPLDEAISSPYWGVMRISDSGGGTCSGPVEARYTKDFSVPSTGEYQIEAVIGVTNCAGCIETATFYIDGIQIFQRAGINANVDLTDNQTVFLETFNMNLNAGTHSIELGVGSTVTCGGDFHAAFDNIVISSVVPPLTCGAGTVEVSNECVVDPAITQEITNLETIVTGLLGIIDDLLEILAVYAPISQTECSEIQTTIDQKIADGKKVPPKLLENLETCEAIYPETSLYEVSVFANPHCTPPGCGSSIGASCDVGDIALRGDPLGVYETPNGQTYNVFESYQTTENTPNDSWRWNFEYSGAPVGEQEGNTFHATCYDLTP